MALWRVDREARHASSQRRDGAQLSAICLGYDSVQEKALRIHVVETAMLCCRVARKGEEKGWWVIRGVTQCVSALVGKCVRGEWVSGCE